MDFAPPSLSHLRAIFQQERILTKEEKYPAVTWSKNPIPPNKIQHKIRAKTRAKQRQTRPRLSPNIKFISSLTQKN